MLRTQRRRRHRREGFSVRRIRDTPNAQINISAKAWAILRA
jgi:hypothetical protein